MSTTAPAPTFTRGDLVRVGLTSDVARVESVAPATLGGPLNAVLYWPEARTRTVWPVARLTHIAPEHAEAIREADRLERAYEDAADARMRLEFADWTAAEPSPEPYERSEATKAAKLTEAAALRAWLEADRRKRELARVVVELPR